MRLTAELCQTTDGVEGHFTREGSAEPEPFSGWLELLRIFELPPADEMAEILAYLRSAEVGNGDPTCLPLRLTPGHTTAAHMTEETRR